MKRKNGEDGVPTAKGSPPRKTALHKLAGGILDGYSRPTMSMEHKAYAFDYAGFEADLRDLLEAGLASGEVGAVREYVLRNRADLFDPYEGEPLGTDWEELLETRDVHQYGDFALTRFYRPSQDVGLGAEWIEVSKSLDEATPRGSMMILGRPIGPRGREFDPGKLGAYFQSPAELSANVAAVGRLAGATIVRAMPIVAAAGMLEQLAIAGRGAYVTF